MATAPFFDLSQIDLTKDVVPIEEGSAGSSPTATSSRCSTAS